MISTSGCWTPPSDVLVQVEHGEDRVVDDPLFLGCEATDQIAEATHVDGAHLLDEHACPSLIDRDLWSKRRHPSAGRCGRYEHDRAWKERIRLHDDTEPVTTLFVTSPFR